MTHFLPTTITTKHKNLFFDSDYRVSLKTGFPISWNAGWYVPFVVPFPPLRITAHDEMHTERERETSWGGKKIQICLGWGLRWGEEGRHFARKRERERESYRDFLEALALHTQPRLWLCYRELHVYTHTHGAALGDRFSSAGRKKRRREWRVLFSYEPAG